MSEHDVTQESSGETQPEPNEFQPGEDTATPEGRLAKLTASVAKMDARAAERRKHNKAVAAKGDANVQFTKARDKYCPQFGWTEAQFTEYWKLRDVPKMPGEAQSEWNRLLDKERKRVKAQNKPGKNARVKDMTPEQAKKHRQKQVSEAVARHRADKAATASLEAAAAGERALSDEELALIDAAVAEAGQVAPATLTAEQADLADMLASLQEAVEAEENS